MKKRTKKLLLVWRGGGGEAALKLGGGVAMRLWIVGVLLLGLVGVAWAGDAVAPADKAEIQRVISAQIEAFRRNDGAAALKYAAPAIKQKFGDATQFMEMVRQAFGAVYRPRSVTFGEVLSEGGLIAQKVEVVGPDGKPAMALYDMEHEPDGSWRISGCRLLKSELQET